MNHFFIFFPGYSLTNKKNDAILSLTKHWVRLVTMVQNTENYLHILRQKMHSPAGCGIPVYLYFAESLEQLICSKHLAPGTRLPVDRTFAEAVGISHITIARGLNELRKKGLIERSRVHGTFVSTAPPRQKNDQSLIAVLFDDIKPEIICSTIFPSLYNELSASGYKMLFYSAAGDSVTQSRQLIDTMQNSHCSGALVWSIMNDEDFTAAMKHKPANWPLVFLNCNPEFALDADSIRFYCLDALFEVTRRFLASGGERIRLCVTGDYQNNIAWQKIKHLADQEFGSGIVDFEPPEYLRRKRSKKILVVTNWQSEETFCGKYVQIIAGSDKKNISVPTIYFHSPHHAKKAVELLKLRISSPQSAYRHWMLPYSLLNMEQVI